MISSQPRCLSHSLIPKSNYPPRTRRPAAAPATVPGRRPCPFPGRTHHGFAQNLAQLLQHLRGSATSATAQNQSAAAAGSRYPQLSTISPCSGPPVFSQLSFEINQPIELGRA